MTDAAALAKKAWLLVQQIDQFRADIMPAREAADRVGPDSVNSALANYNFLLGQARAILELDRAFLDLIVDLREVSEIRRGREGFWSALEVRATYERLIYESGRLSATLRSFVTYYLSREEKQKIGF